MFVVIPYKLQKQRFMGWRGNQYEAQKRKTLWETRSDERDDGRVPSRRYPWQQEATMEEKAETVKKARTASAPGPNGVLYKVYKKPPKILK